MKPKERVLTARLLQKLKTHPQLIIQLGIAVSESKRSEMPEGRKDIKC